MKKCIIIVFLTWLSGGWLLPVMATENDVLSVTDAVRMAIEKNPAVKRSVEQVKVMEKQKEQTELDIAKATRSACYHVLLTGKICQVARVSPGSGRIDPGAFSSGQAKQWHACRLDFSPNKSCS